MDITPIPISIRKLKKYYVRKIKIPILFLPAFDGFVIYIPRDYCNLELPNLYINKKIIEHKKTRYNRRGYNRKITNNKISIKATLTFILGKTTLYYVFDSESEYLKWKLSV